MSLSRERKELSNWSKKLFSLLQKCSLSKVLKSALVNLEMTEKTNLALSLWSWIFLVRFFFIDSSEGSHSEKVLQLDRGYLFPKHFSFWPIHKKVCTVYLILPATYFWVTALSFEQFHRSINLMFAYPKFFLS